MADSTEPIARVSSISPGRLPAEVPAHIAAATHAPATDSVALSDTAKATALQAAGESISEIAKELGIPTSEVESDLRIAVTESQPAATATATQKPA